MERLPEAHHPSRFALHQLLQLKRQSFIGHKGLSLNGFLIIGLSEAMEMLAYNSMIEVVVVGVDILFLVRVDCCGLL